MSFYGKYKKILPKQICVLDCETELISKDESEPPELLFTGVKVWKLKSSRYRPMRYQVFLKGESKQLLNFLKLFQGPIIGHNILDFDFRVLSQFFSIKNIFKKTVDTLLFLYWKKGNRFGGINLDILSQLNLGEQKNLQSKKIIVLWKTGKRKEAFKENEHHCELTKKLWLAMLKTRRVYLRYWINIHNGMEEEDLEEGEKDYFSSRHDTTIHVTEPDFELLLGHRRLLKLSEWEDCVQKKRRILTKGPRRIHAGQTVAEEPCPKCHCQTLTFLDELREGTEFMTDGQLADYEAGHRGTIVCKRCSWSHRFGS